MSTERDLQFASRLEGLLAQEASLQRIAESFEWYMDRWVNPAERFEGWMDLSPSGYLPGSEFTPASLDQWRAIGRRLAFSNPFAINGHSNIQHFVAGTGFTYKIVDPRERSTFERAIAQADDLWAEFHEAEKWDEVEKEVILRSDRDGEAFVRVFLDYGLVPTTRFIDPMEVRSSNPDIQYGIITRPGDRQKVLGLVLNDKEPVSIEEVTFFKKNTDRDVLRGVPTFLPVVEPLERAKKMLRVTAKMAEIQAAIAAVREHPEGTTGTKIAALADAMAQRTPKDLTSGDTFRQRVIQPGTILDVPPGQKYHFPIAGQSADKLGIVIDILLRACAARVSQPEFLFSMNAANSNYASLIAAEQPGIRAFEVAQGWYTRRFRELYRRVIFFLVASGQLSRKLLDPTLKYKVTAPAVRSRDRFTVVRSNDLLAKDGIKSRRTIAEEEGLDFDREQQYRKQDGDEELLSPKPTTTGQRTGAPPK